MNFFDKLCLGEQGIKDVLGLFLIIAAIVAALLANMEAGMWGGASEWNLLASVLYMLFWIAFPKLFGKSRFLMKTGYIISICTFIAAICSSGVVLLHIGNPLQKVLLAPALVGLITTVPFYGLTVFGDGTVGMFDIYYPTLAVIALLWTLYMKYFLKKE